MARDIIHFHGQRLRLRSSVNVPNLTAPTVLAGDPWDYVALWLRREGHEDAGFYWDQAREFFNAGRSLASTASPLTSYYCMLNMSKALLSARGVSLTEKHGVSGRTVKGTKGKHSLSQEEVTFEGAGVLASLCTVLGDKTHPNCTLTLADIFYHLPFLHRAYVLTYKSTIELFIPLRNHGFMRDPKTKESWFFAEVPDKYVNKKFADVLPKGFEVDGGMPDPEKSHPTASVIRWKQRFKWDARKTQVSLVQFDSYHRKLRRHVEPIYAPHNRWYLKKNLKLQTIVDKSQMSLTFAAMHKLSELSRYDPLRLHDHLNAQHNWLVSEFLNVAPAQFLHAVASEIAGQELLAPDSFRST